MIRVSRIISLGNKGCRMSFKISADARLRHAVLETEMLMAGHVYDLAIVLLRQSVPLLYLRRLGIGCRETFLNVARRCIRVCFTVRSNNKDNVRVLYRLPLGWVPIFCGIVWIAKLRFSAA